MKSAFVPASYYGQSFLPFPYGNAPAGVPYASATWSPPSTTLSPVSGASAQYVPQPDCPLDASLPAALRAKIALMLSGDTSAVILSTVAILMITLGYPLTAACLLMKAAHAV